MAILYSEDVKMTALLEKLVSILAPHHCIICGTEDNILCTACAADVFIPIQSLCVFCEKPTTDWQVCKKCARPNPLNSVWVAAEYGGLVADLLHKYKFERVKAAYKPLAVVLDSTLPYLELGTLIVPLPTVQSRVRQRGYDQSVLLAKELARLRGLKLAPVLERAKDTRQVGADRKQRIKQADLAYNLLNPNLVKNKAVWLIDDICTTGASLRAAAGLIKNAGAKKVHATVVAWQRLRVKD